MASIITEFKICFKSLEDYTLINDVDHHDRATELAALQTHVPKQFEAILELVTIKATKPLHQGYSTLKQLSATSSVECKHHGDCFQFFVPFSPFAIIITLTRI